MATEAFPSPARMICKGGGKRVKRARRRNYGEAFGMVERDEKSKPVVVETSEPVEGGKPAAREIGGRDGPEPTRYGDWEVNGICVDF